MTPNDFLQPMEVTKGYFADAEMMKDFIDYLFDVEQIGGYDELFSKFKNWEKEQINKSFPNNNKQL